MRRVRHPESSSSASSLETDPEEDECDLVEADRDWMLAVGNYPRTSHRSTDLSRPSTSRQTAAAMQGPSSSQLRAPLGVQTGRLDSSGDSQSATIRRRLTAAERDMQLRRRTRNSSDREAASSSYSRTSSPSPCPPPRTTLWKANSDPYLEERAHEEAAAALQMGSNLPPSPIMRFIQRVAGDRDLVRIVRWRRAPPIERAPRSRSVGRRPAFYPQVPQLGTASGAQRQLEHAVQGTP